MGGGRFLRLMLAIILVAIATVQVVSAAGRTSRGRQADMASARGAAPSLLDRIKSSNEVAGGTRAAAAPILNNFEVLGHETLGGRDFDGDVYFFDHGEAGKYAYVGTAAARCTGRGVKIVRVSRPRHPKLVAVARRAKENVDYQDPVVAHIGNRDILAAGVQICDDGGVGGLALFNVTKPNRPRLLSFLRMPSGGVHELDMVVRPDGMALALLAVPFAEPDAMGGDFRIVDVTRPRAPVRLSDWELIADSSLRMSLGTEEITSVCQGIGYFPCYYDHSARGADDGMTAYVSFWDTGELKFDISDPAAPVLVGQAAFTSTEDDGDTHSMTPYDSGGTRYVVTNDEDFEPLPTVNVTSNATGATDYQGLQVPLPTLIFDVGEVSGPVVDANDGCEEADFAGAEGQIVLVDVIDEFFTQAPCRVPGQLIRAAEAGAAAVLMNWVSQDRAFIPFVSRRAEERIAAAAGEMTAALISDIDGLADALRAAPNPMVDITSNAPSWGFLRVFSEAAAADSNGDGVVEYTEVGQFHGLPHVHGEFPTPPGVWTIHNSEALGNRVYSSWYSHGIVAIDMSDPTNPTLAGQFAMTADRRKIAKEFLPKGPFVWGVDIDPETGYVYASDMASGLWILKPTGAALPTP